MNRETSNKIRAFIFVALLAIMLFAIGCTCNTAGSRVYLDCHGNILPCANLTYDIGSPTMYWHNLYVENINGTLTGNVTGTGIAGRLVQWSGASSIANATNTDAQVVGAVANSHVQNTDTILTTNGVIHLIDAGLLENDLDTDRWLFRDSNTFLGVDVLGAGTLAHTALIEGWENTAIGNTAGHDITTGYSNTLIGSNAGNSITTGYDNTAVGADAGQAITTANSNAAFGDQALMNNTGNSNTAIGKGAMGGAGAAQYNTAVGMQTMNLNTGDYNTALGVWAGTNNTGDNCVLLGYRAGEDNIGDDKLYIDNSDTATPLIYGDFASDYININGDLYFATVGSGLPFGDLYSNTANAVICTVQNQWYQIPFDVIGAYNLTTPSIVNDDITIIQTGTYLLGVAISKYCANANDFEYAIFLNNGTTQIHNMVILETTLAGTKSASSAATGIYASLTAGDTVELWVRCTDAANKTINITHADLNLTMVGR